MQMPTASAVRGIIVLVDESIRGDYIDWTPGNRYTPDLARLKDRIVDFGPTSSGSNCSDYSNAILRFAAAPNLLGSKLLSIPTIWQYAKKADFRTVFIDAQAAFNKTPGKLQNFMTREEILDIDRFYALDEHTPSYLLDDKLFEIITQELDASSDHAVFIYANKNGAHFPYDGDYPKSERLFHPTMSGIGIDNSVTRVNSYRNAIRWSVDRLFGRFFNATDLTNVVVIYTSDHGQAFNEGRLSHCTIERPDPREGLVPLFVVAGSDFLRARFTAAAESSRGHVSHFSITPTVLELMGYASGDMSALYGPSLFEKNSDKPAFTTGDIFGLFSTKILWHQIDLDGTYLESASASPLTQE
jgi:lipid A ethanolaminephosphotransferase